MARTASIGGWGDCSCDERSCTDPGRRRLQRGDQVGPERPPGRRRAGRARATPRTAPSAGASASHSVSSVVLPNPAGADTRVSADSAPRLRRSLSLGRGTRAASQPGDVELGLEQWACHDHLPSGASSQVPSTSSVPATHRSAHNGHRASRSLETTRSQLVSPYAELARILLNPERRFRDYNALGNPRRPRRRRPLR